FDELLGNGQPQAQSALAETEVARGMSAGIELGEKRLKQVSQGLGFHSDALILDLDLTAVGAGSARGDLDQPAVGRELDRVGEKVDEDRADLVGVDLEFAKVAGKVGGNPQVAHHGQRPNLVDDAVDQLAKVDRVALECPAKILGAEQGQDVVDHSRQLAA